MAWEAMDLISNTPPADSTEMTDIYCSYFFANVLDLFYRNVITQSWFLFVHQPNLIQSITRFDFSNFHCLFR